MLTEIEVTSKGAESRWLLPLAILWEDETSAALPNRLALARVRRGRRLGLLTDAFALPTFAHCIIAALAAGRKFKNPEGTLCFQPTAAGQQPLPSWRRGRGQLAQRGTIQQFADRRRHGDAKDLPSHLRRPASRSRDEPVSHGARLCQCPTSPRGHCASCR